MAPKTTPRKNSIGDLFVDKIDVEVMRNYLRETDIPIEKVDPALEAEPLGVAMTLFFRDELADDDLCKCEKCGGEGPASEPNCVFCGVEGGDIEEESEEEGEEDTDTDTSKLAAVVEAEEPQAAKKRASAKKEAPAKKGKAAALTVVPKAAAIADSSVVYTARDLDKAVERVVKLKSMAALSFWTLGDELRRINEQKLWKLRVTENGKAKYTSFDQFVEQEAKIGHTHAYNMIAVADEFTEADVKEFGTSKLTLILKAAPEDRPALKEKAKSMGKRALAREVEAAKKESGRAAPSKSPKHSKAGKEGAKAKAKAKPNDKITIATIEGRKTVKLFAKPTSIRNIDWSTLKRAKSLAALPFGKLELTNEVTIFLSVVVTDAGLEIVAVTRRDDSEA